MQIEPIVAPSGPQNAVLRTIEGESFSDTLGSALDNVAFALTKADALAASVAAGKANIADAAIARAKADVMLEVAAIAAARVSGAIATLMQTQV